MSGLAALMGLLGLGVGLGLLTLLRAGRRNPAVNSPARKRDFWRRLRGNRGGWWIAAAGAGALVIGIVTGWVIGAVLAALATWTLPRMLGSNAEHRRHIARIEAIAGWTEMLRYTLAAAAGLEQAITVTIRTRPPNRSLQRSHLPPNRQHPSSTRPVRRHPTRPDPTNQHTRLGR